MHNVGANVRGADVAHATTAKIREQVLVDPSLDHAQGPLAVCSEVVHHVLRRRVKGEFERSREDRPACRSALSHPRIREAFCWRQGHDSRLQKNSTDIGSVLTPPSGNQANSRA
jgi:hypothetical protein